MVINPLFQRNLIYVSNLHETWDFVPYNISRPPKKHQANNHYDVIFHQDPRRLLKATGITGRNFLQYFRDLRNIDLVQVQSSDSIQKTTLAVSSAVFAHDRV